MTHLPRIELINDRIEAILSACAKAYGVGVSDMIGNHKSYFSAPRAAAVVLLRDRCHLSYIQASRVLGYSGHTSSLNAAKRADPAVVKAINKMLDAPPPTGRRTEPSPKTVELAQWMTDRFGRQGAERMLRVLVEREGARLVKLGAMAGLEQQVGGRGAA